MKEKLMKILNDGKLFELLAYLMDRWQDEWQYEDFKDYENRMKSELERFQEVKFIKGTKKPFGFVAEIDNKKVKVYLKHKNGDRWCLTAEIFKS